MRSSPDDGDTRDDGEESVDYQTQTIYHHRSELPICFNSCSLIICLQLQSIKSMMLSSYMAVQSVDHCNLVCYDSNLLENQEKLFLQRSIRLAIIQNCRTVGRSIRIHRIYIFRLHKMLHLPIEATI